VGIEGRVGVVDCRVLKDCNGIEVFGAELKNLLTELSLNNV